MIFYAQKDYSIITELRLAYLKTCILIAVIILFLTELLSLFNNITHLSLIISWSSILVILATILWVNKGNILFIEIQSFKEQLINVLGRIDTSYKRLILVAVLFIILPLLFLAIYVPPNTWDAMTYHLSRVEHWIQNNNVEHYPTPNIRQLFYQPFAEYCIMHLRILSRSDFLTNSVQYFSMIGSIIGISVIGRLLGLNYKGQILTSIICISLPMGILQSTSSQNDYVATFFFVSFLVFGIKSIKRFNYNSVIFSGIALSLALITKAYIYIYALPFIIWFSISEFLQSRKKAFYSFMIFILIFFAINSFYFKRNHELNGNIFGMGGPVVEELSIRKTISNISRNIGLQIGLPFEPYNKLIKESIVSLHDYLDVDVNTIWGEFNVRFSNHEDSAGGFIILNCIILSTLFLVVKFKKLYNLRLNVLQYFTSVLIAFVIFSVIFSHQPWISRFLLCLMIAVSPFLAYTIYNYLNDKKYSLLICYSFLISGIPYIYFNNSKPIIHSNIARKFFKHLPSQFPERDFDILLSKCTDNEKILLSDIYSKRDNNYHRNYFEDRSSQIINIFNKKINLSPSNYEKMAYEILRVYKLIDYDMMNIFKRRENNYFNNRPRLSDVFINVSSFINNLDVKNIGLIQGYSNYEYPLWMLIKNNGRKTFYNLVYPNNHVFTHNYNENFEPDVVISFGRSSIGEKYLVSPISSEYYPNTYYFSNSDIDFTLSVSILEKI